MRLGLITGWLPVRVLPAPPRSPALTPSSPSPRNTLDFPRFGAGAGNEDRPEADWGPSSLASQIRFPVRGEGPGQRLGSLRQRPVCMQEIRGPSALQTDPDRGLKLTETGLHARDSRTLGFTDGSRSRAQATASGSILISCRNTSAPKPSSTRLSRHNRRAAAVAHQSMEQPITQPAANRNRLPCGAG